MVELPLPDLSEGESYVNWINSPRINISISATPSPNLPSPPQSCTFYIPSKFALSSPDFTPPPVFQSPGKVSPFLLNKRSRLHHLKSPLSAEILKLPASLLEEDEDNLISPDTPSPALTTDFLQREAQKNKTKKRHPENKENTIVNGTEKKLTNRLAMLSQVRKFNISNSSVESDSDSLRSPSLPSPPRTTQMLNKGTLLFDINNSSDSDLLSPEFLSPY